MKLFLTIIAITLLLVPMASHAADTCISTPRYVEKPLNDSIEKWVDIYKNSLLEGTTFKWCGYNANDNANNSFIIYIGLTLDSVPTEIKGNYVIVTSRVHYAIIQNGPDNRSKFNQRFIGYGTRSVNEKYTFDAIGKEIVESMKGKLVKL